MSQQNRHSADEEWRVTQNRFQDKYREHRDGEIGSLWKNKQGDGDAYFKVGKRMMSFAGGCQSEESMKRGMPEEENYRRKV